LQSDIAKITKASKGMAQILDELLELAKVGRIVNPFVQVASAELIEEALKQVEVQLKNRVASVNLEQGLPTIFVDKTRIQEVLVILIDNSIKFVGDQADPVIKIGFQNSESEFVFHIKDNGIGIDRRYLEQIFGLFDRLDSNVDGSGVGLTLAKRIIELHHGKIWAESKGNGLGSTFRFSLPKLETELLSTG
jgi:two-component system sensor kinase FixL